MCGYIYYMPQFVAYGAEMKSIKFVYIKGRLDADLHKKLKAKAQQEERSMNYLINKAV
ncbi:hypothetical protein F887_01925 [Acinetobacter sp. NIPH 2100]|nr:hypothetical protein F887_01925 [Acinetobacter sp. NIPH 2100]